MSAQERPEIRRSIAVAYVAVVIGVIVLLPPESPRQVIEFLIPAVALGLLIYFKARRR